ncbi:hypothetical protein, partial [Salmonella sp. gx-f5]|uniref:hypothetical protein n=1 Tax=Salmonella sp. gx-f5 TaxID=2582605 RepID=UPI001F24791D
QTDLEFLRKSEKNVREKGKHRRNGNYQKSRIQLAFVNMLPTILRAYTDELKKTTVLFLT